MESDVAPLRDSYPPRMDLLRRATIFGLYSGIPILGKTFTW